jgi:hypothetical protein
MGSPGLGTVCRSDARLLLALYLHCLHLRFGITCFTTGCFFRVLVHHLGCFGGKSLCRARRFFCCVVPGVRTPPITLCKRPKRRCRALGAMKGYCPRFHRDLPAHSALHVYVRNARSIWSAARGLAAVWAAFALAHDHAAHGRALLPDSATSSRCTCARPARLFLKGLLSSMPLVLFGVVDINRRIYRHNRFPRPGRPCRRLRTTLMTCDRLVSGLLLCPLDGSVDFNDLFSRKPSPRLSS